MSAYNAKESNVFKITMAFWEMERFPVLMFCCLLRFIAYMYILRFVVTQIDHLLLGVDQYESVMGRISAMVSFHCTGNIFKRNTKQCLAIILSCNVCSSDSIHSNSTIHFLFQDLTTCISI